MYLWAVPIWKSYIRPSFTQLNLVAQVLECFMVQRMWVRNCVEGRTVGLGQNLFSLIIWFPYNYNSHITDFTIEIVCTALAAMLGVATLLVQQSISFEFCPFLQCTEEISVRNSKESLQIKRLYNWSLQHNYFFFPRDLNNLKSRLVRTHTRRHRCSLIWSASTA